MTQTQTKRIYMSRHELCKLANALIHLYNENWGGININWEFGYVEVPSNYAMRKFNRAKAIMNELVEKGVIYVSCAQKP